MSSHPEENEEQSRVGDYKESCLLKRGWRGERDSEREEKKAREKGSEQEEEGARDREWEKGGERYLFQKRNCILIIRKKGGKKELKKEEKNYKALKMLKSSHV